MKEKQLNLFDLDDDYSLYQLLPNDEGELDARTTARNSDQFKPKASETWKESSDYYNLDIIISAG